MGNDYYSNPLEFLITTLGSLYVTAVMLRFLLQAVRADFYNPISQFLVKITNPPLTPLRRFIPGLAGLDMAAVVLMLVLQMAIFLVITQIKGIEAGVGQLFLLALIELIKLLINVFFFAIIVQAILSWVQQGQHNPAAMLLWQLTDPVMKPVRRILPPVSGIDLSPILALIGLKVLEMLIIPPLQQLL